MLKNWLMGMNLHLVVQDLLKVLFSHQPFVDKFMRDGELLTNALWSFCNSVNTFKKLLFAIIQLIGAPKRITEFLLHKLFNTLGRQRNVRHIILAIFEHYNLDVVRHPSCGANIAQQQGHSLNVARRLYANSQNLPNTVTSAWVMEISEFSKVLHAFWGLASPDGPTEVTAESLKKFAECYNPEAKFDALVMKMHSITIETQNLNQLLQEQCSFLEDQISAMVTQVHALSSTILQALCIFTSTLNPLPQD
ncbi:hypothetical protein B0H14DRAFT_2656676 [Mycena olivaceomarginata]|nr:hypothetical protein B0H14DRAFT_2656676 [Mycena olivaceomarginata]